MMHAHGSDPQYAQLLTGDGRSLIVALPISTSAGGDASMLVARAGI
jgi:hypothetical protein